MINISLGTNSVVLRVENPQPYYILRLFSDNFGKSYEIPIYATPRCNTIIFDLLVLATGTSDANVLVLEFEGNYRAELVENGTVVKEFITKYLFSPESKTTYSETQEIITYK
jgi:hypothetical protein